MEYLFSRCTTNQAMSNTSAIPDDQSLEQVSEQDLEEEQEPPCPSAGTLPISQGESSFLTMQDFQAVWEDRDGTQQGPPQRQVQPASGVPTQTMSGNTCFFPQQWSGGFYFPAQPSGPTGLTPAAQQWSGCPSTSLLGYFMC